MPPTVSAGAIRRHSSSGPSDREISHLRQPSARRAWKNSPATAAVNSSAVRLWLSSQPHQFTGRTKRVAAAGQRPAKVGGERCQRPVHRHRTSGPKFHGLLLSVVGNSTDRTRLRPDHEAETAHEYGDPPHDRAKLRGGCMRLIGITVRSTYPRKC